MTSLEIIQCKKTIKDYVDQTGIPKEVIRLVLKEIYDEVQKEALNEALTEINKNEEKEEKDE